MHEVDAYHVKLVDIKVAFLVYLLKGESIVRWTFWNVIVVIFLIANEF
jgi:hypothetical protein